MNGSRITLKDVAEACGYTVNTVSRALRDDPRLPPATRAKLRQTAFEMGYIRNSLASTLRSGKSGNVAVIVNDIHNLHFCNMLSKIDVELRRAGYNMMVLCMQLNESLAEQMIHSAISQSVDGILFFPYHDNPSHIEYMENHGIPFVLLDRWIQGKVTDNARCDDLQGGYLAGDHLARLGHRRYLFLSGVNQSSSQLDRLEGFRRAMRDHAVPDKGIRVVPGEIVEEALAERHVGDLLFPMDYTAIISFRDEVSYPVMLALEEQLIAIPRDISIVSFDHLRGEIPYLPKLTSIYADGESVAVHGVRLLLKRIADRSLPPQVTVLPVRLYDEGTTAPPVNA
ncbi:MAG: LacI family DNA-binding transcriptional regulator [Clostridia bacterium]|nr:LacI family DNA-binding transcriptional regulator [Clostridia bacterium]